MTEPSFEEEGRSIFQRDGDLLVPSGYARGPWYPNSQHGSAMLGLLARAVENHPAERPMRVVRLLVDLPKAAPLVPVSTPTRLVHSGKTMDLVEAAIEADGKSYARATAMRIRDADLDVSTHSPTPAAATPFGPPPAIAGKSQLIPLIEVEAFHMAVDIRLPVAEAGHALWMRLRYPLVAGEATSPFVRTAALADWTYSVPIIAREIREGKVVFRDRSFATINPDAGIHIHRSPHGPWICFNSEVHYGAHGAGTASAQVFDDVGPVGHTSQVILIRPAELQRTIHDS
jgi:hypothetical protein